ncbi:MAG: single-stranded-DNA-specific exonuclease RecJ [Anaerolineales bacterium]
MPSLLLPPPITVPEDLRRAVGGHPLVAELLYRRGIHSPQAARAFLNPQQAPFIPPEALPDLQAAVERLAQAIHQGERILVWGDFDVDGQTSTALLVDLLRSLGADVHFYIPLRATESHGVHRARLERLLADPGFDVLLTCDTGISAYEAAEAVRAWQRTLIITDHHELGERLPPAHAVITPRRLPAEHPFAGLPGVGVAYQLAAALLTALPSRTRTAADFLDLTALGIVADVAEQRGATRTLLQHGLEALRHTRRLGLQILAKTAGLNIANINEDQIGFGLGPRLNALGRLDDANAAVELLTTDDEARATTLALQLETLNVRRRFLTEQVYQAAQAQLARDPRLAQQPVIVLGQEGWPGGVVGIVASRLVEEYGRPVILFSLGEDGLARGSARSIEGIHITEAIAAQQGLLLKYGGHPMAAGCSLKAEDLPAFREGLARTLKDRLPPSGVERAISVDAEFPLDDLTPQVQADFERLAPFGAGNPQPRFVARGLQLVSSQTIGRDQSHRRLVVRTPRGAQCTLLWWRSAEEDLPASPFDLVYTARLGTYRGETQLQILWECALTAESGQPAAVVSAQVAMVDARQADDGQLAAWRAHPGVTVWGEGLAEGLGRHALPVSETLLVWTAPPSFEVFRQAVMRVRPRQVVFVGRDSGLDEPQAFLNRLAGVVKYAIQHYAGELPLVRAAAATAQRMDTLFAGLAWLAAEGYITLQSGDEEMYRVQPGNGIRQAEAAHQQAERVRYLLEETARYRRYLQTAALPQFALPDSLSPETPR